MKRPWHVIVIVLLITVATVALYRFWDQTRDYGEAEPVADLIHSILIPSEELNITNVKNLIAGEKYNLLRRYEIRYTDDTNAILWVNVNKRFTIGLGRDGNTLWQTTK
jgi:hypothetical protein